MKLIISLQLIVGVFLIITGLLGFVTPNEPQNYHAFFKAPYSIAEIIIGLIMTAYWAVKEYPMT